MTDQPPLSAAEIAAMRARCEAATPGPWVPYHRDYDAGWYADGIRSGGHPIIAANNAACGHKATLDDKLFIAAARTDVPKLLDELERCRSMLAAFLAADRWKTMDIYDVLRCRHCGKPAEVHASTCIRRRATDYLRAVQGQPAEPARG